MLIRIKADDSSVPAKDGKFSYYQRFDKNSQHPIFCRQTNQNKSSEEILVNSNEDAVNWPFFRISRALHSPDHQLFAFSVDTQGSELYTIRIVDIQTRNIIDECIKEAAGSFEWSSDSASLIYTSVDANYRPNSVYRHVVGNPQGQDELIYEETAPGFFVSIIKTECKSFFVINAHDHQTSESYLLSADNSNARPRLILKRETGVEYNVTTLDDKLFIHTNSGDSEDFKIVCCELNNPSKRYWTDFIPHRPGRLITKMYLLRHHLVWLERAEGIPILMVRNLINGAEHAVTFTEEVYDLWISRGHEFDTTTLRFVYSSLATPWETYDYDLESRERILRKRQEVPSGHDPSLYRVRRVIAPTSDGEEIPISLVYAANTPLDGTSPLLLYGYGAYGVSIPASFSTHRFSLIDRGFIYAIAHIRGGMECGYRWYRDGRGEQKHNTFEDFACAAKHLISKNYSSSGQIVAMGGSAGGLLVGAVLNNYPEIFGCAVAEVPFVDVLNTISDSSLPLTPPEWPEWGNPINDISAFNNILSYSPYENVGPKNYPPLLVTAGLSDPRVTYWEPAKWVACLRDQKIGDSRILLKTNMEAGHGGTSGRFAKLKEIALIYAFILIMNEQLYDF